MVGATWFQGDALHQGGTYYVRGALLISNHDGVVAELRAWGWTHQCDTEAVDRDGGGVGEEGSEG